MALLSVCFSLFFFQAPPGEVEESEARTTLLRPAVARTLKEIKRKQNSLLTLPEAFHQLQVLLKEHPENAQIQKAFKRLSHRCREHVRRLAALNARLRQTHGTSLNALTDALITQLVRPQAGGAHTVSLPKLSILFLLPPDHTGLFGETDRISFKEKHFNVYVARNADNIPGPCIPVKLETPSLQLLWEKQRTGSWTTRTAPGTGSWKPNPQYLALEALENRLHNRLLSSPTDHLASEEIARIQNRLLHTERFLFSGEHPPCHITTTTHLLHGTFQCSVHFPLPPAMKRRGGFNKAEAITVRFRKEFVGGERGEGSSLSAFASFSAASEKRTSRQARQALLHRFTQSAVRLLAEHIAETVHNEEMSPDMRAEWETAFFLLRRNPPCLPASYHILLERSGTTAFSLNTPFSFRTDREDFPLSTSETGHIPSKPSSGTWCQVQTAHDRYPGVMLQNGIIATPAACAQANSGHRVLWPDGSVTDAFLWAWDRAEGFALVKTNILRSTAAVSPPRQHKQLSFELVKKADRALERLLPLGRIHFE